jgi:hypothetical protein
MNPDEVCLPTDVVTLTESGKIFVDEMRGVPRNLWGKNSLAEL